MLSSSIRIDITSRCEEIHMAETLERKEGKEFEHSASEWAVLYDSKNTQNISYRTADNIRRILEHNTTIRTTNN
jgi:hypothetical protein